MLICDIDVRYYNDLRNVWFEEKELVNRNNDNNNFAGSNILDKG